MNAAKALAALFLSVTPSAAAATDVDPYYLPAVPSEYLGRWNVDARSCAAFSGRHRLVLHPKGMIVGGDSFRASYVGFSPHGEGIVISSDYVGPAKSWSRTDFFRLEKGGAVLVGGRWAKPTRRVRCR